MAKHKRSKHLNDTSEVEEQSTPRKRQRNGILVSSSQDRQAAARSTDQAGLKKDAFLSNKDVLSHISSFLDIKSLYNFTMTSSICMQTLRPEHVVRAALYHGGHSKTNLERIVHLMRGQRIIIPSTLRLLRLCNGRLCELCQNKRVYYVSKYFGVFFCQHCLEHTGYVRTLQRFEPLYPLVSRLYVIPDGCHAIKIWAKPYFSPEGERCGPRITLECHTNSFKAQTTELLQVEAMRNDLLPLIENTYKNNVENANLRILMHREQKCTASLLAQRKRTGRIKYALTLLDQELGNVAWKKYLLAHEWVELRSKDRIVLFAPLAKEILGPYLSAPSTLTKPRIHRLASMLRSSVALFEDLKLHNFALFLRPLLRERNFENNCVEQFFPNYSFLTKNWVNMKTLNQLRCVCPVTRIQIISQFVYYQLAEDDNASEGMNL